MTNDTRNSTCSLEEIERDIAADRQQLQTTIDEALSRFTFEDAWKRVGGYLIENRSAFGHTFGRVLRERSMGVMLTAVGLAWPFFGLEETAKRRSSSSRRLEDERVRDRNEADRAADLAKAWETPTLYRRSGVSELSDDLPAERTNPASSPVSTEASSTNSAFGAVPVTPQKRYPLRQHLEA